MEEKKQSWYIVSTQVIGELVVFKEEVTSEEAMELYHSGNFEDIIDSQSMSVQSVSDAT